MTTAENNAVGQSYMPSKKSIFKPSLAKSKYRAWQNEVIKTIIAIKKLGRFSVNVSMQLESLSNSLGQDDPNCSSIIVF